ncbi:MULTISPECIES: efflux RND transporter permease subunit [Hydrocarboniphaga]|jgi:CzcA family heavy metal efflux pump|uniref:efflux RND transporter permease subunit n=1 Tax=Hydrocarboniphaga TaxID=243627 RepID=UPI002ABA9869|nr:efflux RND transporter permease subunit [Hydrocarboniphaga sp.]MDZ4077867.1 efflux RND transporter permease subunit [Hydrocarboniphaga sp.]
MLSWIVSRSLSQSVLVVALACVLMVLGFRAADRMPLDVFPEFAPPLVEIQTEAPGLSTEEVESLITVPLETAVNGVPWLKTLRSKSVLGLSSVVLLFEPGTDVIRARQLVQERLTAAASRLPLVARPPVMLAPLSSTSRALKIGVTSATHDEIALTELAQWTIRPRLMAVPGVANVAIWGQRSRQLQVLVDPQRLAAASVTVDEVARAAGSGVAVIGGGFIDTPQQRLAVRHLPSVQTPDDLARTVIRLSGGAPIRIGDVAEVRYGHAIPVGAAVIDDQQGLLLIVEKQPWSNTLEVTRGVEAALDQLRPGLSGVKLDSTIFRPATFIEDSLHNLTRAMVLGCVLVVFVLFAFTRNWRPALISLTAIPLSLLAAALVLYWQGGTLNTMVIAGLVIALGEVVDDAIIDVENIARRLRLNRELAEPLPLYEVVLQASLEVRSAVVFATMIVMLVFVPVFLLDGLAGTFFRPLATSYVIAILASLIVALTVTPVLSLWLLPKGDGLAHGDPHWLGGLKRRYRTLLPRFLAVRPAKVSIALGIGLLVTAFAASRFHEQFLPDFKERDFLMHWIATPGASLDEMTRITQRVSRELREIEGVRNFGSHIGRAEVADEVVGPNFAELWVSVEPTVDYDVTLSRINEVVSGYPGLFHDVLTYLRERIKEVLTGASATLVVRLYGDDMDTLRSQAEKVRAEIAQVPGAATIKVEPQVLVPQLQVRVRPEIAASLGLNPGDVRRAASTMLAGTKIGETYEGQKIFDVVLWSEAAVRSDLEALRSITLQTPAGARVPLGKVADVFVAPAANEIKRESASRRLDVSCDIESGADLGAVARGIETRVRGMDFPQGYHPEFLGEYQALRDSRARLGLAALGSVLGILVLLYVEFKSLRLTAVIAASLPFALIGGVVSVWLGGGVLSLGSLVGFVTVLGIAARNGIMLVAHYRHLQIEEGMEPGWALVIRGAEERLAPILMTASCAALALLPLVIEGNVPGHEIEYPLAIVILGGLVSSTLLSLLVLPALYSAFGTKASAS